MTVIANLRDPVRPPERARATRLADAARLLVVGLLTLNTGVLAQGTRASDVPPAAAGCARTLDDLNAGLRDRRVEALLAAATLQETGRCVARDDAKAAQYLGEAARGGSRAAALRLARKFGRGAGVKQSYANAGAWITGKGLSEERIDAWDYSIGYAYTVTSELLSGVNYPPLAAGQPAEISFVIEIDAVRPMRLAFRATSTPVDGSPELLAAVERAFSARLAEALKWLPAPDPKWLVAARVAVPVSIRYDSSSEVAAFEDELLLR